MREYTETSSEPKTNKQLRHQGEVRTKDNKRRGLGGGGGGVMEGRGVMWSGEEACFSLRLTIV